MSRPLLILLRCFIVFLAILFSQCTPIPLQRETSPEGMVALYSTLTAEGFQEEAARLKEIADTSNETSERARAHLSLALLYSHYRNPSPHYQAALNELALYESLDPEGSKSDTIRNWTAVLRQIVGLERETKSLKETAKQSNNLENENKDLKEKMEQCKNLENEYRSLKEKVEQLKNLDKENKELKEKVEQLKELDIELEKRRKIIK